jgi:hypothetical protein
MPRNWSPNTNPTIAIWALVGAVLSLGGSLNAKVGLLLEVARDSHLNQPADCRGDDDAGKPLIGTSWLGDSAGEPSNWRVRQDDLALGILRLEGAPMPPKESLPHGVSR